MKQLQWLSDVLDKFIRTVTGILVIALCSLTFMGVIFRFVLNNPIQWLYESSIVMFTWMMFLGASMAFKRKEHIHISYLLTKMSPRLRFIWQELIYVVCLFLMIIVFKDSIGIVKGTWKQMYNTIPVSKGIFYLSFNVGSVISMVHIINHMVHLRPGLDKEIVSEDIGYTKEGESIELNMATAIGGDQ